jgi:opacity protein-like surface antigen
MSKRYFTFVLLALLPFMKPVYGQDLMSVLNENEQPKTEYTDAIFKATRIVIGQSVINPPKGNMVFLITHHFGAINTGYDNLFGLKQATIRIGAEYGLTDWLGFGAGLNTLKNTWDGFIKFRALRQSTGARKMPINLTLFASTAIYTTKWENPDRTNYFTSRMSYAFQVMLARKFGQWFTLQVTPSMVHINMVNSNKDHNDIFTLGAGGRVKVSKRVSVNAEYHYLFPHQIYSYDAYSSLSVGVDIETGGHVFQIFLTNSMGEFEESFLPETTGTWGKGQIFLGFNITRMFTIVNPKI